MSGLSKKDLNFFIAIGNEEQFDSLLPYVRRNNYLKDGSLMRNKPEFWYETSEDLSNMELEGLIKTFTIAEKIIPNWKAGSVSPVIWLFRKLRERINFKDSNLEKWIIDNTDNNYLPYGSFR